MARCRLYDLRKIYHAMGRRARRSGSAYYRWRKRCHRPRLALAFYDADLSLEKAYQLPYVLISRSRDGNIVAHASHRLGLKTIRGSAKKAAKGDMAAKAKGGAKASMNIVTALENNGCIVVTPDGPRGPRQRLGDGPIRLAKLTGVPLMPCTFAVRNRKQLNSWDKLVIPLPFGKGKIIWGTPVNVPADADERKIEHIRERIESEMNIYLADADRAMGHAPIEPDEK